MADETIRTDTPADAPADATVDAAEVRRFSRLAGEWWDPRGKMAVLHKFNPVRLTYIRDAACRQFGRNAGHPPCLDGIRILDIGCGGGALSAPLPPLRAPGVGCQPAQRHI